MLSRHIATWPLDADRRTALFALQLVGWTFRLDPLDPDAGVPGWVVTGELRGRARRSTGATPGDAVRLLLSVLAEHQVMEPGWHVIARRPGERFPRDLATVPTREDAMVRGMIMLGRTFGAEVFAVRFCDPPQIVEIVHHDPMRPRPPAAVPADERDG